MTTATKPPPKFATNEWAWNHTLHKLSEKGQLGDDGNPKNYAAAAAIYKRVVRKYGDNSEVPDIAAYSGVEATRAQIVQLQSEVWTISRGFAWAADDNSLRRIWLHQEWREAKHPLGAGKHTIEPLVVWRAELTDERFDTTFVETFTVPAASVMWLFRDDSAAHSWAGACMAEALDVLDIELGNAENDAEVGGVPVNEDFHDRVATATLIKARIKEFEAEVPANG